jgi:ribose 5-phosphate isomerase B
MALRANKYPHIRAALVYNDEITLLSREHNNANVICLGSRFCNLEQALRWIDVFKKTAFAGGRHQTRVAKVGAKIT